MAINVLLTEKSQQMPLYLGLILTKHYNLVNVPLNVNIVKHDLCSIRWIVEILKN